MYQLLGLISMKISEGYFPSLISLKKGVKTSYLEVKKKFINN